MYIIAEFQNMSADLTQGNSLLRTPYFNKGSAFTKEERDNFKLHGLLPTNIQTLDEQVKRAYAQYSSRPNDLAKNTFMTSLKEQNEVLYYKVCPCPV
jgi:malate dehydrogenase (oxaloacetate-decarboxylating)